MNVRGCRFWLAGLLVMGFFLVLVFVLFEKGPTPSSSLSEERIPSPVLEKKQAAVPNGIPIGGHLVPIQNGMDSRGEKLLFTALDSSRTFQALSKRKIIDSAFLPLADGKFKTIHLVRNERDGRPIEIEQIFSPDYGSWKKDSEKAYYADEVLTEAISDEQAAAVRIAIRSAGQDLSAMRDKTAYQAWSRNQKETKRGNQKGSFRETKRGHSGMALR